MIDPKLLQILRCPIDGKLLSMAEDSLVRRANQAISSGQARDRQDQKVTQPIEAGLVGGGGEWMYPIRNRIPTLITDEAIALRSLD